MSAPDIFLSYNREDAAIAKRFADVCSPNFNPKNGHSASHPKSDEAVRQRTPTFQPLRPLWRSSKADMKA